MCLYYNRFQNKWGGFYGCLFAKRYFYKERMMKVLFMRSDYSAVQNRHCTFWGKHAKIKSEKAT